jgi:N utilization substance protein B
MGRRASREIAMKLLYQLELQRDDREEQLKTALEENSLDKPGSDYIMNVVEGVKSNMSYIDKIIDENSKGWKISRMSKVDLSILRLGIYEISFREDVPLSVAINEAVELAKKYSSEESGAFINGLLGKFSKEKVVLAEESKD